MKYFRALAALLVAAGEALAQETRSVARRIVISIPDRKLALVEDGRAVKIYPVAVGAAAVLRSYSAYATIMSHNRFVAQLGR